eukprot:m.233278 g.233278  ORF g.233278 m.233278 type:complete len:213 (+) comp33638_c0_seq3:332-970(+)
MADREPSELVQRFFAGDAGLAQVVDACVELMIKSDDAAKHMCSEVHLAYLAALGTNEQSHVLASSLFDELFKKLIVLKKSAAKVFSLHYILLIQQSWTDESRHLQKYQVMLCLAGLLKCESPIVIKMKRIFEEFDNELLNISQSTEHILGVNADEMKIVAMVFDIARSHFFANADSKINTAYYKDLLVAGKGVLTTRKAALRILEVEAATRI